ncbi:MAG: alpha-mannosidase [Oscillospiraceae bacterium]|nr:alpha-mannosidase [Oscillospiraceae bacterium]
MAHIKVQRRSMRKEEYIDLRYGWLKRYIHENMTEIVPVYIRNARQTGENEFYFYEEKPYELKKGDLYYTPDGSIFFEAEALIPEALSGKEVYLFFKTTSEVIVKVNGKYAGGVDPNRMRVHITPYIQNGRIKLEMLGFNRSKPDDERNPETFALRGCRQEFGGIYLCSVNSAVQSLCWDLEALTDIISSELFDENYREQIKNHVDAALNFIDFDNFSSQDAERASDYIEKNIYSDKTYKGSGRVALVAHSHLDIAYYWRRLHTVQKNLRTVLIQLRLMDKYPEFTYCHTQPYVYETLKKYYPEVFSELKESIAAGRFEPVGAMYVEPDCNVPNAESLIRQCLYGQKFYEENFGFIVNSCWLPDVFGNSWILPQILKKSGVDYFVSNKMSTWNDTNRFPHNNFLWRGIDGTDIYACVPPTHFITWNEPSQVIENWEAFQDKNTDTETLNMFGYGDGGSGVTDEMIELMRRFDKLSVMPETRHIRADRFLKENFTPDKDFAVWDGELYLEMHRGTFTTKSELKKKNRVLEEKFRVAELISVLKNSDYPEKSLRELYKKFLLQQFHDILPGSHITPVYKDAMDDLCEVEKGLDAVIGAGEKRFNALNFERGGVEFIPNGSGEFLRKGITGDFGRIKADSLGYAEIFSPEADLSWIKTEENKVSTPFYDIEFDSDGSIISLFDKENGRQWADGAINKLRLYDDRPGNYDAWDILPDYAEKPCEFILNENFHLVKVTGEAAQFSASERTDKSIIIKNIRLFRTDRSIECEINASWFESHKLLKAEFNANVLTRELICDTSAGFIRRPMHKNTSWEAARFECCTHKWFDICETDGGFAVINDGKYGVGINGTHITLSLLRATERPDPQSDIGEHSFCYKIVPHAGSFTDAGINRLALIYNSPLIKTEENLAVPSIYKEFEPLYLQAVKLGEDGKKIICRLTETDGRRGALALSSEVTVCDMLERELYKTDKIEFKPFEIITVAI